MLGDLFKYLFRAMLLIIFAVIIIVNALMNSRVK